LPAYSNEAEALKVHQGLDVLKYRCLKSDNDQQLNGGYLFPPSNSPIYKPNAWQNMLKSKCWSKLKGLCTKRKRCFKGDNNH